MQAQQNSNIITLRGATNIVTEFFMYSKLLHYYIITTSYSYNC